METWTWILALVALALGAAAAWLLVERGRLLAQNASLASKLELSAAERERHARELSAELARREEVRGEFLQREAELKEFVAARDREMSARFKALAADTLKGASDALLQLASERFSAQHQAGREELEKREAAVANLVKPIHETMRKTDETLGAFRKEWTQDRSTLQAEIRGLGSAGETLRTETAKLARALAKPEVRGRYGETQLRRVAELAGMVAYCDFEEQSSQRDADGRLLRPDMTVYLPNDRCVAVDAKCNLGAYVDAANASTPEERESALERFADHVAQQVKDLGRKGYWAELEGSPEFVVMFVPGDQFLDAALSRRADLLERAAEQNVILASPATLIGLLRAVALGWREKRVEEQARELIALGCELHERASVALAHVARLGEALDTAVGRYNDFVASYESRLEPTLRRFEEADVKSAKRLPALEPVTRRARELEAAPEPPEPPAKPEPATKVAPAHESPGLGRETAPREPGALR
jgi:DNA recombination protein RmuC